jgi:hypothetical protein
VRGQATQASNDGANLVVVGIDLRACGHAHAGHRQIPAALRALIDMIRQAPHPAGSPCAMPGQIGPVVWRSSADIAAKAA